MKKIEDNIEIIEKTNKNSKKKIIKETNDCSFKNKEVIFIVLTTCIISLIMGSLITRQSSNNNKLSTIKEDNSNINEIIKTYESIIKDYNGEINEDDLVNGAVKGMLDSIGDKHTSFIEEDESSTFNATLDGEFKGLGLEIVKLNDGNILVVRVFEDSPADAAGIKAGDIITGVDDKLATDMSTSEFSTYVRNKNGNVLIYITRNEEKLSFDIKTSSVTIKSVYSDTYELDNKKIGYLSVSIFASNTYEQFKKELENLEKSGIDSLIIDLRDNSGGHLEIVKKMISLFLDSSHIIYQTDDGGKIEKFYSTGKETKKYKIIILANNNSASASEIMMGSLKEEYGATIVGETSYGKGSVQELRTLSNGSQYKITIKKWLTPKGNCIDNIGIKPDYEIKLSDEYYENPTKENDNQLNKALELAK